MTAVLTLSDTLSALHTFVTFPMGLFVSTVLSSVLVACLSLFLVTLLRSMALLHLASRSLILAGPFGPHSVETQGALTLLVCTCIMMTWLLARILYTLSLSLCSPSNIVGQLSLET